MISRWPSVYETFHEDGSVPGTKPNGVNVVIMKLRAAVRDEVYKTVEQRLCSDRCVLEEVVSRVVQMIDCSSAQGVEVLVRTVQDWVHLVFWVSAVRARESCSSLSWILEPFGVIAARQCHRIVALNGSKTSSVHPRAACAREAPAGRSTLRQTVSRLYK